MGKNPVTCITEEGKIIQNIYESYFGIFFVTLLQYSRECLVTHCRAATRFLVYFTDKTEEFKTQTKIPSK